MSDRFADALAVPQDLVDAVIAARSASASDAACSEPRAPQSESVRLGHVQPNILFHRNPPSDFAASPDLLRGLNLRRPAMTTALPVYLQQRKILANGRHRRSVPKSGSFMRAEPRGMPVGPF